MLNDGRSLERITSSFNMTSNPQLTVHQNENLQLSPSVNYLRLLRFSQDVVAAGSNLQSVIKKDQVSISKRNKIQSPSLINKYKNQASQFFHHQK
jgi:hypothetical protein